ncbi:hypothetical protein AAE02nite_12670 [Adhaeribacter aerolatus]|uniref:Uncharacterized protein n=1 Tax=Adhaeribacter aerolatus TaxID=670289 RepID=A0A512AV95_9BACT|nr:hypothetical protein [Adhaeribacter aerolatus]GEO03603.1 hypothetical protein AAE02nite_12670 [Adhaeribacter aerolatus]
MSWHLETRAGTYKDASGKITADLTKPGIGLASSDQRVSRRIYTFKGGNAERGIVQHAVPTENENLIAKEL